MRALTHEGGSYWKVKGMRCCWWWCQWELMTPWRSLFVKHCSRCFTCISPIFTMTLYMEYYYISSFYGGGHRGMERKSALHQVTQTIGDWDFKSPPPPYTHPHCLGWALPERKREVWKIQLKLGVVFCSGKGNQTGKRLKKILLIWLCFLFLNSLQRKRQQFVRVINDWKNIIAMESIYHYGGKCRLLINKGCKWWLFITLVSGEPLLKLR